jgi:murein DD-endopeptidase MepM/ murein hydrolase activator NlpD
VKNLIAEKWPGALVLILALLIPGCAGTEEGPGPGPPLVRGGESPAEGSARTPARQDGQRPIWTAQNYADRNRPGRLVLIPENPRPGDPVTLALAAVPGTEGLRAAELLNAQGRRLSRAVFFPLPVDDADNAKAAGDINTAARTGPAPNGGRTLWAAVLAVPSTARAGPAVIRLDGIPGPLNEVPLTIGERDFATETIELNRELTELRTLPDPQKTAESERLWAILSRAGTEIYCPGAFVPPVASTRRTSFFGDRRIFKYSDGKSDVAIHAGVDYGVPTGTPVTACGPGKVVLAGYRIVTGNSVVLEHLPGVYSIYYHLDRIAVSEGTLAAAGTLLGTSGATGLATGPHLHWEIRVSGENTDPDAFTARPLLDKNAILARINAAAF